jgi:hypothetical protein
MQYYTYDSNSLYTGAGEAQPGDVPDSWLYPNNSTTLAPPTDDPGKYRWDGAAWEAVTAEELSAALNATIKAQLAQIDQDKIRPAAELLLNPDSSFARNKLAELEAQAIELRTELAALSS